MRVSLNSPTLLHFSLNPFWHSDLIYCSRLKRSVSLAYAFLTSLLIYSYLEVLLKESSLLGVALCLVTFALGGRLSGRLGTGGRWPVFSIISTSTSLLLRVRLEVRFILNMI